MADELLRARRAREAANPGKTYKQLNEMYAKEAGIPYVNPTYNGIIKSAEYDSRELTRVSEEHNFKKIELYNKMNSCGESKIGRSAKDGKHGIIMNFDEPEVPAEMPKFNSPAEKSRYLYELNRKKMINDSEDTKLVNSVTSHHLIHQIVDQESLASKTIEEVGKTSAAVVIGDAKEHLINTHEKMQESVDYKIVTGIRKLRMLDESDEGSLGEGHKNALNGCLRDTANALHAQELGTNQKNTKSDLENV